MCAKCESKKASPSWRLLAAQGLRVNAISAFMMQFARKGGKISVYTAGITVTNYIKWLDKLERPGVT